MLINKNNSYFPLLIIIISLFILILLILSLNFRFKFIKMPVLKKNTQDSNQYLVDDIKNSKINFISISIALQIQNNNDYESLLQLIHQVFTDNFTMELYRKTNYYILGQKYAGRSDIVNFFSSILDSSFENKTNNEKQNKINELINNKILEIFDKSNINKDNFNNFIKTLQINNDLLKNHILRQISQEIHNFFEIYSLKHLESIKNKQAYTSKENLFNTKKYIEFETIKHLYFNQKIFEISKIIHEKKNNTESLINDILDKIIFTQNNFLIISICNYFGISNDIFSKNQNKIKNSLKKDTINYINSDNQDYQDKTLKIILLFHDAQSNEKNFFNMLLQEFEEIHRNSKFYLKGINKTNPSEKIKINNEK
jgi:hypothetical protein